MFISLEALYSGPFEVLRKHPKYFVLRLPQGDTSMSKNESNQLLFLALHRKQLSPFQSPIAENLNSEGCSLLDTETHISLYNKENNSLKKLE